jgi:hypothetical protein
MIVAYAGVLVAVRIRNFGTVAVDPTDSLLAQRAIEEARHAALVVRGVGSQRGGVRRVGKVP